MSKTNSSGGPFDLTIVTASDAGLARSPIHLYDFEANVGAVTFCEASEAENRKVEVLLAESQACVLSGLSSANARYLSALASVNGAAVVVVPSSGPGVGLVRADALVVEAGPAAEWVYAASGSAAGEAAAELAAWCPAVGHIVTLSGPSTARVARCSTRMTAAVNVRPSSGMNFPRLVPTAWPARPILVATVLGHLLGTLGREVSDSEAALAVAFALRVALSAGGEDVPALRQEYRLLQQMLVETRRAA